MVLRTELEMIRAVDWQRRLSIILSDIPSEFKYMEADFRYLKLSHTLFLVYQHIFPFSL